MSSLELGHGILTPDELVTMRADLEVMMDKSAVITRPVDLSDSQGGNSQSWEVVGTVPARLEPQRRLTGGTEVGGMLPKAESVWFVIAPAGTDLRPIDRVTIGAATLEVTSTRSPRSDELSARVECMLLNVGGE